MNIALVGTGRMGQAVEAVAAARGHAVVARFDETAPLLDADDPSALNDADLCIDFSTPDVALDHLHRYSFWGVDAVVGTTGWTDEMGKVERWVEEGQNAILWAPNFSLGVALLVRAVQGVLPLLNQLVDFDAAVFEAHHTGKLDSPGGTALMLGELLRDGLDRKAHLEPEAQHGAIAPEAVHVVSQRVGHVFGEHAVTISGPHDGIKLMHRALGREGFAAGAVRAAEWLAAEPREGVFTFEEMLSDA